MKSGTPELIKFKQLQRRLSDTRRGVIGLLEGLWMGVAKNCPQGDIGRFTDEEIAILCDYEGDPELLVKSLVECGWLDRCDQYRLIVHDWCDHAPSWVHMHLTKVGLSFIRGPTDASTERSVEASTEPSTEGTPSQAKPSQALIAAAKAAAALDFGKLEGTGKIGEAATRLAKSLGRRKIAGVDPQWIWGHAAVAECLRPGFMAETAAKVAENQIAKPKAYIEKALREECLAHGTTLKDAIEQAPPMPERSACSV